jgi:hypothetical protein
VQRTLGICTGWDVGAFYTSAEMLDHVRSRRSGTCVVMLYLVE